MMDDDRAFIPARGIAHAAPIPITFQHSLSQPTEILLILSLERIAGRAKAMCENLGIAAPAIYDILA
jgi:hypothetical protein